jgi:D-beta-D-heptose 7-phosphate kinase/D-beta-D-heptose 1-phosphate adenosyltransferase
MSAAPLELIDRFAGLRVVVVGDAMLDGYLEGTTGRLCPEAPVPIVAVTARHEFAGGAANTAVNASALGASTMLLSVVGDDPEGERLEGLLAQRGVGTSAVLVEPGRRTLTKTRVMADSQMLGRLDEGSTDSCDPRTEAEVVRRFVDLWSDVDAVIVSDYGYGAVGPAVIRALGSLQTESARVVAVDSKRLAAYRGATPTAVKPNHRQALDLVGGPPSPSADRFEAIAPHADRILEVTGARIVAVTMDGEGAAVFERGKPPYRTYARPVANVRAAGAGDTFTVTLALALAAGGDTPAVAELASVAAAAVVGKERTATCSADELRALFSSASKVEDDLDRLAALVERRRSRGDRIVFTNGCFDILHRGHITYLNQAKALGEFLVVGVNVDDGVRRLKGPGRPINRLEDRVEVLAALSGVDLIVPFADDTPVRVIEAVRPDVFVKGGDYRRDMLPEAEVVERLGGVVRILPYLEDRSTTGIIEAIRQSEPAGVTPP